MKVAFDCDGTLINYDGTIRTDIARMMIGFVDAGCEVTVWSGGGKQYAENILHRVLRNFCEDEFDLEHMVTKISVQAKNNNLQPDIAFDDQYVALGITNVTVPPNGRRQPY